MWNPNMRNAYISTLYDLARENRNILALVSDNGAVVYDDFRRDFPDQFLNVGISEQNLVSLSAGLAVSGKIPFAYTIAGFLTMRAFEQVRNDVCLQKTNVKLVGIGVGFVYSDLGPTHHTTEDIALMRSLPGMTIFSPADPVETRQVTRAAAQWEGPVYIRLATSRTPTVYEGEYDFQPGRGVTLRQGRDLTIISSGNIIHEVLQAVDRLKQIGISTRLINLHTLKPIDEEIILQAADETQAILTVEEHTIWGGLGSAVAEIILEKHQKPIRFKRLGLPGVFPHGYGSYQEMKRINGLHQDDICREAVCLLESKKSLVGRKKRSAARAQPICH
jgi:transketolase